MQIIGIYLFDGNKNVIKNLKEKWYPFGDFDDCHGLFDDNGIVNKEKEKSIKEALKKNKSFGNCLYQLDNNPNITVNLNCIVGMNGSGKSTLLSLEYRIINNLACKIKHCLPSFSYDYHPSWASGFNAELYYELNENIYCIKVSGNKSLDKKDISYHKNRVTLLFKNNKRITNLFNSLENIGDSIEIQKLNETISQLSVELEKKTQKDKSAKSQKLQKLKSYKKAQETLLTELSKHIFYSIATNYSLYSNSVVKDEWEQDKEKWMNNLFHKNDGYLTPIVLVPYKDKGATIDTLKELDLAKERVTTLSTLLYTQNKPDFIEGYTLKEIHYKLKTKESYKAEIRAKYVKFFNPKEYNSEKVNELFAKIPMIDEYIKTIRACWEEQLFIPKETQFMQNWQKKNKSDYYKIFDIIKENTLEYLTFKFIKMCKYYDFYRNQISDSENPKSDKYKESCEKIIKQFCVNYPKMDFSNLKIIQCIEFLNNLNLYIHKLSLKDVKKVNTISIIDIVNHMKSKIGKDYTYDKVFINLLPSFFNRTFYYINEDQKIVNLSALSSGQSQLCNTMSYSIYHMKNASSSDNSKARIVYKYINLILDEAELYYHPEYQRSYIHDLIGILGRSNLENVVSINITIVTHSPFMLSDIPNENVICLDNGKRNCNELKTLGANFYDLLQHKFFINSGIGEVTETIINEILSDYKKFQGLNESSNEKMIIIEKYTKGGDENFYYLFADKLADNYLHDTFCNIIEIMKGDSFISRRKKMLNEKIAELEKQEK